MPTCQKYANFSFLFAKVPKACYYSNCHATVPTCQRQAKYSTWCANVPKACQLLKLSCQRAKKRVNFLTSPVKRRTNFSTIFQNNFFNFWIFQLCLSCKFHQYLGNSRKFVSRNKEFEFSHLKISLRKNIINLKPLTSFSMEHVGLTKQLFGYCKMEQNIFFHLPNFIRRL